MAQTLTIVCSFEGMRTAAERLVSCHELLLEVLHAMGAPPPTVSSSSADWPADDFVSAENCTNLWVVQAALKDRMPEHAPAQVS